MFGSLTIPESRGKCSGPFSITQRFTYVGKGFDCDIRIPNTSAKQFLLTAVEQGKVKIQNLTEENPTLVNEKSIGFGVDHDLREKDIITAAGYKVQWSYQTQASNVGDKKRLAPLKRARESEPIRKVAVVTPNRRENVVNNEELISPKRRRKTLYEGTAPHNFVDYGHTPLAQSSFARRIAYDRMIRSSTPNRRRLSARTPGRLSGGLGTPRGSAQNNADFSYAHPFVETLNLPAAFNKSITPRTFYASRNSNAPYTFRGFNSVAEESNSSLLSGNYSSMIDESSVLDRRSGRISTPLLKRGRRTPRNRDLLSSSAYFPTLEEEAYSEYNEGRNPHVEDVMSYDVTGEVSLHDQNQGRRSTPASYFSPTTSGTPRRMRAESPNIQDNRQSQLTERRSAVSSRRSTPYGTPQEDFNDRQQDSLFVNTSGMSLTQQRRSQNSLVGRNSLHESTVPSPLTQTYHTPSNYHSAKRGSKLVDSPGGSTYSPTSYNDTDYVLLSPRGKSMLSRRYDESMHSGFSSPYSPSQRTLDFTASPQQTTPTHGKSLKRSLSIQVLTKSLQKKTKFHLDKSNTSSPKRLRSKRKSKAKSNVQRSASVPALAPACGALEDPHQLSTIEGTASDSESSMGVRRRSAKGQTPSKSPSNKMRKSGSSSRRGSARHSTKSNGKEDEGKLEASMSTLNMQEEDISPRVSRRSTTVSSGTPITTGSPRNIKKSVTKGIAKDEEGIEDPQDARSEGTVNKRMSRRSSEISRSTPLLSSARKSLKEGKDEDKLETSLNSSSALKEVDVLSRVSRQSSSTLPGTSSTTSSPRSIRKSAKKGAAKDEEDVEKAQGARSEGTINGRLSRRSLEISQSTPSLSSARKSQKEDKDEEKLETSLNSSSALKEVDVLPRMSRRSFSTLPGTSSTTSSPRSIRKSAKKGAAKDEEDVEKAQGARSEGTINGRLSRRSLEISQSTPSLSSARKSQKEDKDEEKLETSLNSSSALKEVDVLPRMSRRSFSTLPGTSSTTSSPRSIRKSAKKGAAKDEEDVEKAQGARSEGTINGRLSRRSLEISRSTPSLSSARKSQKEGKDEGKLETSMNSSSALKEVDVLPRVSRRSSSTLPGTSSTTSSPRSTRKSAKKGAAKDEEDVEKEEGARSEGTINGRLSRRSLEILQSTPSLSSARKSQKGVKDEDKLEASMKSPSAVQEVEVLPRVSRRSISALSGTPNTTSSPHSIRKSVTKGAAKNEEGVSGTPNTTSSPHSIRKGASKQEVGVEDSQDARSEGAINTRLRRQSSEISRSTPLLSSPRKSQKAKEVDGKLDVSTSTGVVQEESKALPRVLRRSTTVLSGTPNAPSSPRTSRKSDTKGAAKNEEVVEDPQEARSEGAINARLSRRSSEVLQSTPTAPSSPRNIRKSATKRAAEEGETEGNEDSTIRPRLFRRSTEISHTPLLSSPRKSEKRREDNDKLEASPATGVMQEQKNVSLQVTRQSTSVLSGPSRTPSSPRTIRKNATRSAAKEGNEDPQGTPSDETIHTRSSRRATETSLRKSTNVFSPKSGSSQKKQQSPKTPLGIKGVGDVKPLVTENGSLKWPVPVSTDSPLLEDVKPLRRSLEPPKPTTKLKTAVRFDNVSPSTSFTSFSELTSLAETSVSFSTPSISIIRKAKKVTSTPFPLTRGAVEPTLPIEVDTTIFPLNPAYALSDSPHYDTIAPEELFVTDAPGTSARTSAITKSKGKMNRSVSFASPNSKNVLIKHEMTSPEKVTPTGSSLEVNLRSSRKMSTAKKASPSTPLRAIDVVYVDHRLAPSLAEASLIQIAEPAGSSPLATTLASPKTRRSADNVISTSFSERESSAGRVTPTQTLLPEVNLRSSRKSASRSTSDLTSTPQSSKKQLRGSGYIGGSAAKKLKLDPKPDKKKMAALWQCHKKKSPEKTMGARRSFEKLPTSPMQLNKTIPKNFRFQTSDSSDSVEKHVEDGTETLSTPLQHLDEQPQKLSPEDDLLNALDLSRKSSDVTEPQKPSRRLRSTTRKLPPSSSTAVPAQSKPSPAKGPKKLLFRAPLVDYEGSQIRSELRVNSSNIKSILIPSPTRSSDEPMSRVFTTSPVVDYTDITGKKKIFRASPTSKGGGIRELIPSEEIDTTGVRELFERASTSNVSQSEQPVAVKKSMVRLSTGKIALKKQQSKKLGKVAASRRSRNSMNSSASSVEDLNESETVSSSSTPVSSPARSTPPRKLRTKAASTSKVLGKVAASRRSRNSMNSSASSVEDLHESKNVSSSSTPVSSPARSTPPRKLRSKVASTSKAPPKKLQSKDGGKSSRDSPVKSTTTKASQRSTRATKAEKSKLPSSNPTATNISPKKLRSKGESRRNKASSPEKSPVKSPKATKVPPKNPIAKKAVIVESSPKKLRSKGTASKIEATTPTKTPTKSSTKKGTQKKSPAKTTTPKASPKHLRAKKVEESKSSPKKLRSKESASKEKTSSTKTPSKSPAKKTASKVSPKNPRAKKAVTAKASPRKLRSKETTSKSKVTTPERSPKKTSTQKGSQKKTPAKTSTQKGSQKKTPAKTSTQKGSQKKSPAKTSAQKGPGKKIAAKPSTQKGSQKKTSTPKKGSQKKTPKKASTKKPSPKKTLAANSPKRANKRAATIKNEVATKKARGK